MNPTTNTEAGAVADVAAKLTKSGTRALLRIGREWTNEGAPGPSRANAYTLGWGKDAKHRLVERQVVGYSGRGALWAYKLTPLGLAVRQHLEQGATAGVAEMNEPMFEQGDK